MKCNNKNNKVSFFRPSKVFVELTNKPCRVQVFQQNNDFENSIMYKLSIAKVLYAYAPITKVKQRNKIFECLCMYISAM